MSTGIGLVCMFGAGEARPARTPISSGSSVATAEPTGCASCHILDGAFSHPVDMVPSMGVPAYLPLRDGRMTCTTCHDEGLARDHEKGGGRKGDFVRPGGDAIGLCVSCHTSGTGRAGSHGAGLTRAHLQTVRTRSKGARPSIDGESIACMSCHDGATARDAGNHRMLGERGEFSADHPIGVPLEAPRREREELVLRPASGVDHRVRLFDGNVGCGSCHSVYSSRERLLVMSNARSALCTSCHVQ